MPPFGMRRFGGRRHTFTPTEPAPETGHRFLTEVEEALPDDLVSDGQVAAWGPRDDETAQEWVAFHAWLMSGAACPDTALARRHDWQRRATTYHRQVGDPTLLSPEQMAKQYQMAAQTVLQIVMTELPKYALAAAQAGHPGTPLKDLVTIMHRVMADWRLVTGQSTENISVKVSADLDLSKLTDDEFAEWSRMASIVGTGDAR